MYYCDNILLLQKISGRSPRLMCCTLRTDSQKTRANRISLNSLYKMPISQSTVLMSGEAKKKLNNKNALKN